MASLWSGRFEKEMDDIVKHFNASIGFDQRMYNEDIDGSIAHVTMLGEQNIVSKEEAKQIVDGLEKIREKIANGEIVFDVNDEFPKIDKLLCGNRIFEVKYYVSLDGIEGIEEVSYNA
jgi:argininosuccinate lyase